MNLFHRHKFDPAKWSLLATGNTFLTVLETGEKIPRGIKLIYSNTCVECGDLVFRKMKEGRP